MGTAVAAVEGAMELFDHFLPLWGSGDGFYLEMISIYLYKDFFLMLAALFLL